MPTVAGVGTSNHRNPKQVGKEAAERALKNAGISDPDFVMVFGTAGYDQAPVIKSIREVTKKAPLVGCSGEGIISSGYTDESPFSVIVMVIKSDELRFKHALVENVRDSSEEAAFKLGQQMTANLSPDSKMMLAFPDGLVTHFEGFKRGWQRGFQSEKPLPIFGGYAGDNMMMKKTYQYFDDKVVSEGIVAVMLQGNANILTGIDTGCSPPIGSPQRITKTAGNAIFEINGKRATDWLTEYLAAGAGAAWDKAQLANGLVFCLAFKARNEARALDEYVIRGIPGKDDASGAFFLTDEVVEGSEFYLTIRDPERMQQGVEALGSRLHEQCGGKPPKFVFQFDCAGRGKIMLPEAQRDKLINTLQSKFPKVPWIGFYTFGELVPVGSANLYHNYTVSLVAVQ